jgi:hypothetical protein
MRGRSYCVAFTDRLIGILAALASGGLARAFEGTPRVLQAALVGIAVGSMAGVANFVILTWVGFWPGGVLYLPVLALGVVLVSNRGRAMLAALRIPDDFRVDYDDGPVVVSDSEWLAGDPEVLDLVPLRPGAPESAAPPVFAVAPEPPPPPTDR